jgi:hypothetical protein
MNRLAWRLQLNKRGHSDAHPESTECNHGHKKKRSKLLARTLMAVVLPSYVGSSLSKPLTTDATAASAKQPSNQLTKNPPNRNANPSTNSPA